MTDDTVNGEIFVATDASLSSVAAAATGATNGHRALQLNLNGRMK